MSRNHTILDLNDYVKLARELDILGDYEKALSKYKTALQIVTQRKLEVTDLSLKDKWNNVENLIKNEIVMTHEALKLARTFKNDDESRLLRAKEEEDRNNRILMRDYEPPREQNQKNNNNNNNYDPRWKHFGGVKPFQIWEKGNEDKIPKHQPAPKKQFDNKKNPPPQKKQFGPGKKEPPKGGKDKQQTDNKKEGKSAFFLHHYPDGEGPDAELIEMVERDVMEQNPNVKFEDIADRAIEIAEKGDLIITLGCGDIYKAAKIIIEKLKGKE